MRKFSFRKWATLRFLIINGHVGVGFVNGVLARALGLWPRTDVILIQEGRHADRWHRDDKGKFLWFPGPRSRDQPMTYVLLRATRFKILSSTNKNITHGGQYPRELDGVVAFDKKTGRTYSISSFHVDPLGAGFDKANKNAKTKQEKQTAEFVQWHEQQDMSVIPFSAGDTNNFLPNETSPGSVRHQFATINMTPLFTHVNRPGKVDLVDLFTRFGPNVKAVRRVYRWFYVKGMDHGIVYGVVKVRKL